MKRHPEPELMDDPEQALAYAEADFEQPHSMFVDACMEFLSAENVVPRHVLDLGCGPGDIVARLARRLRCERFDALDGAAAMIALAGRRLRAEGLTGRVRLIHGRIPQDLSLLGTYDAIVSNSILHHLSDPADLWRAIRRLARPGTSIYVMDLRRPGSEDEVMRFVEKYAAGEPEILRHDFFNSLRAAYRPAEVEDQLAAAGLDALTVRVPSDRHLVVAGRMPAATAG